MRVSVDQARREDRVRLLYVIGREILALDFRARSDLDDAVTQNGDRTVFDHTALCILGDDIAGAPDKIDRMSGWRLRRRLLGWESPAEQERHRDNANDPCQTS